MRLFLYPVRAPPRAARIQDQKESVKIPKKEDKPEREALDESFQRFIFLVLTEYAK